MAKAWTDKTEFKQLSGALAATEGRLFENATLPLIRLLWPGSVGAPPLRSLDRIGVDQVSFTENQKIHLVVQCKGFQCNEIDLGKPQIDQCIESIETFRTSGRTTHTYLLVHNRDGRNSTFRDAIELKLKELIDAGTAQHAMLWDRKRLLSEAFNRMLELVRDKSMESGRTQAATLAEYEPELCTPLEDVPYRLSHPVVGTYELHSMPRPTEHLGDPSQHLLSFDGGNVSVLIGEAGYGKTISALRAISSGGRKVFYVPAANVAGDTVNTKGLLSQCVSIDDALQQFDETDLPTLEKIARPVVEYLLNDDSTPAALILDGLDESIFFTRRGGIQQLFNMLKLVRVPVLLVARLEFWQSRLFDFETSFGLRSPKDSKRNYTSRFQLIELLPWSDAQIILLAQRYRDNLADNAQKANIDKFIEAISHGKYALLYGDVPRRPLFLRFMLETAVEGELHATNVTQLFQNWATRKIRRDIVAPMRLGGSGRPSILPESESQGQTLELAFRAMKIAAIKMTQIHDNDLELLPSCLISDVLDADRQLRTISDPVGLILNSLLVPELSRSNIAPSRIRFAHRAYHEFFLAHHFAEHPEDTNGADIPDSISRLVSDLKHLR